MLPYRPPLAPPAQNVYAFANLHDVSWGTKGSTAKEEALPNVNLISDKGNGPAERVVENMIKDQVDLDAHFKETVARVIAKPKKAEKGAKKLVERNRDDENRTFRTNLILLWLITNAFLAAVVTYVSGSSTGTATTTPNTDTRQANYFKFILWSTFGIAAFR